MYNFTKDDSSYIVLFVYIIVIFLILTGNLLCIAIILKWKQLQTNAGWLMINLSVTDICFGLNLGLNPLAIFITGRLNEPICLINSIMISLFGGISLSTIFLLNLDRYLSITRPLKYHSLMTRKRTLISMGVAWLFSGVLNIPVIFTGKVQVNNHTMVCSAEIDSHKALWIISLFCLFGITSFSLIYMYIRLTIISFKKGVKGSNKKAMKTLILMLLCFYLSWFPTVIRIISRAVGIKVDWTKPGDVMATVALFLNSFWNCLIYAFTNRIFKGYLYRMIGRKSASIFVLDASISYGLGRVINVGVNRDRVSTVT